ncbi:hypothetical protein NPIL_633221, partial [Nephila pilipes]
KSSSSKKCWSPEEWDTQTTIPLPDVGRESENIKRESAEEDELQSLFNNILT